MHQAGDILENYAGKLGNYSCCVGQQALDIDFSKPVIPTIFRMNDQRLSLITTITQFETVQDISLSDLRVEMMFPVDEITASCFQQET